MDHSTWSFLNRLKQLKLLCLKGDGLDVLLKVSDSAPVPACDAEVEPASEADSSSPRGFRSEGLGIVASG